MLKQDFFNALAQKLSILPYNELEERIGFYREMIDDRIEEGLSEEEAVAQMGSVDEVTAQILADIPLLKLTKNKLQANRRMRAWEIVLLAVGSPIWLALLISAFAVALLLYAVLWSLVASVWAVFGALGGCALGGIASGVIFIVTDNLLVGLACIGAALVCAGLGILLFFGCIAATKGSALLTKKIVLDIKKCFIRKGETK